MDKDESAGKLNYQHRIQLPENSSYPEKVAKTSAETKQHQISPYFRRLKAVGRKVIFLYFTGAYNCFAYSDRVKLQIHLLLILLTQPCMHVQSW